MRCSLTPPATRFLWIVAGLAATLHIRAATHYVNWNSTNPIPPYLTWATAATTIQDAVDVAVAGDEVMVTNGVYRSGGRIMNSFVTNRVAVSNAVRIRSLNGPEATLIEGYQGASFEQVRCVYLTNGASLTGFTLTNGSAAEIYYINGIPFFGFFGGGVRGASAAEVVSNCIIISNRFHGVMGGTLSNCVITGNSGGEGGGAISSILNHCILYGNSGSEGGGAYQSTLNDCMLFGNRANSGGGAQQCVLNDCLLFGNAAVALDEGNDGGGGVKDSELNRCKLVGNSAAEVGGGALDSVLNDCLLVGNQAQYDGGGVRDCQLERCTLQDNFAEDAGGAFGGVLNNCLLVGNQAQDEGGGAFHSTLNNCTVVSNSASSGGGTMACILTNCIVYYNVPSNGFEGESGNYHYSCTTPLPFGGTGNMTNEPAFIDLPGGNFRLSADSPCIGAGHNPSAQGARDLDGRPRIIGNFIDLGAYEFQLAVSGAFIGWLQKYRLPTDGSGDTADSDADQANNYQEWRAGTVPTDALSVLRLLTPAVAGNDLVVRWTSVAGKIYFLERSTNLTASGSFTPFAQDLVGQAGFSTYTDTNVVTGGPRYFYRVGVD